MVGEYTTMNSASYYKSFRAEPGILIEVFLPKRNRFQDILYETLKDGFNHEKVMKHFNNKKKKGKINKYLDWLQDKNKKAINKDILKYFETVLWGYSIHEVDGVFLGDSNSFCYSCKGLDLRKKQFEENDVEYEERTQIIKIIFMPDYKKITSRLHNEAKKKSKTFKKTKVIEIARKLFLCYPEKNIRLHEEDFKDDHRKIAKYCLPELFVDDKEPTETKLVEVLICYLLKWIGFTGVFLFGFLIYKICEQIMKEEKNKHKPEDELWVTSHWDFLVNKVLYKPDEDQNEKNNNPNSIKYLNYLLQQTE